MKRFALLSIAILIAGPAMAQSATEATGVNSALGIAPKTADFVTEAAASDMFEIASSKLAVEKGDAETKIFAEQMVADHQKTSDELKTMISEGKISATLPAAMTDDQQEKLDKLKSLEGDDFNKQYHADQEEAHEDAVDLFTRYGDEGEDATLKAWAAKTRPALEHHLEMAKQMNK